MDRFNILNFIYGGVLARLYHYTTDYDYSQITCFVTVGSKPKVIHVHDIDATILPEGKYPQLEVVDMLVDKVRDNIEEYLAANVFCKWGRGRSAMVAACYLMKYKGYNLKGAIDTVVKGRKCVFFTKEQLRFMGSYVWRTYFE